METVLFIGVEKHVQIHDILELVSLKAFDFWRILNSFFKFDHQMPRAINMHFRDTEVKIVSEAAWTSESSVVEVIQTILKNARASDQGSGASEEQRIQEKILQSYNLFFQRVLQFSAERILALSEALGLNEEI